MTASNEASANGSFVASAAENASLAYGLVAVLLSLGFGWGAGTIWRRF